MSTPEKSKVSQCFVIRTIGAWLSTRQQAFTDDDIKLLYESQLGFEGGAGTKPQSKQHVVLAPASLDCEDETHF